MQTRLPRIVDRAAVVSGGVGVVQKHFHAGYGFAVQVEDGPAYINARARFWWGCDVYRRRMLRLCFGLMTRTSQADRHGRTANSKNTNAFDKASAVFYVMDSSRHNQVSSDWNLVYQTIADMIIFQNRLRKSEIIRSTVHNF